MNSKRFEYDIYRQAYIKHRDACEKASIQANANAYDDKKYDICKEEFDNNTNHMTSARITFAKCYNDEKYTTIIHRENMCAQSLYDYCMVEIRFTKICMKEYAECMRRVL